MLDTLRKYATGWVAQILIGLLVLSFAIWGVADVFTGFRSDSIAQVGSTDISVAEFQRDYDSAVQNLSRQFGMQITPQQAVQMGIPGQILGRLVSQATLDEAAGSLGLGMSNETLGQRIATDPQFIGSSGTFDRGYLSQLIRQMGLTEDQFITRQRAEYVRAQLGQGLAGGMATPSTFLRAVHEYRGEERDLSYVIVTAPLATTIADPGETELGAWFEEHKTEFDAPEYRGVTYFALTPETLAKPEEVTDQEARARYDSNMPRFSTAERRQVQQIVFPDRATADAAAESLAGGQTFDALLTSRSLTPADVDLGLVSKDELADPAISDAAFALSANGVSPVVDGRFGPVLLRVTTIEPAVVTPYEEVAAALKTEIANERAVAEINDMYDAIEDNRAGGATVSETASKYAIPLVTVAAINSTGNDENGNAVPSLPANLLAAVFESDVGLENDPVQPTRNAFAWFEVTALTDPRPRTLTEVRDRVVAAWKEEQRRERMVEDANTIQAEVNNRGNIDTAAADLGMTVKKAPKVTRVTPPSGDLSANAVSEAFDTDLGKAAVSDGAQPMTALVIRVDNISLPAFVADTPEMAATKRQYDNQYVSNLLGMYVGELQGQTDIRFNQPLLQQVLGVPLS